MANYLKGAVHVAEFRNTIIMGDGDKWDGISSNNLKLVPATNIGFIGNYGSLSYVEGTFHGAIDMKGTVPPVMSQNIVGRPGYMNIWNSVLRETRIDGFGVVYLRSSGGEYIASGVGGDPDTYTGVVIYSKKYDKSALIGNANKEIGGQAPSHRGFINSSGAVKLTDGNATGGFDVEYRGQYPNLPVPALDEAAWIAAGNNGTTPANLAANYAALDPQYKWSSLTDFNTNAVE
jgi:hypothetical protein